MPQRSITFWSVGSTADTPATLGLRVLAGVIDFLALGIAMSPLTILSVSRALNSPTELPTVSVLVQLLYFLVLEGFWGASLGKAVCGLRVVGPERQASGISRALLRASVFPFVISFPGLILLPLLVPRALELARQGGSTSILIAVSQLLYYVMLALLFSTARRSNGYAGVHELLSKTRTVLRSAHEVRALTQVARKIVVSQPAPRRVGPYEVLGSQSSRESRT
jgi:uncharacterized RDD family membrane protein YckC